MTPELPPRRTVSVPSGALVFIATPFCARIRNWLAAVEVIEPDCPSLNTVLKVCAAEMLALPAAKLFTAPAMAKSPRATDDKAVAAELPCSMPPLRRRYRLVVLLRSAMSGTPASFAPRMPVDRPMLPAVSQQMPPPSADWISCRPCSAWKPPPSGAFSCASNHTDPCLGSGCDSCTGTLKRPFSTVTP